MSYHYHQVASAAEWAALSQTLPNVHPLQSWAWGEVKSRWGWQMLPFVWQVASRPVALALILGRQLLPGLPFSMFYVPKGPGLAYEDVALRRQVLADLREIAGRRWGVFLKIDPDVVWRTGLDGEQAVVDPAGADFVAELEETGWRFAPEQIQFRNTVTLDLTRPEADLLAGLKQKTRYNIRLAEKKGVVIRPGSPADFPLILAMYRETARRDGFLLRPEAYYLDAWQTFQAAGLGQALIAEFEGNPLAAVMLVRSGRVAVYMYGASTDQERQRMPNYLLQWAAIQWAKGQGCTLYDFWGAPDQFVESDRLWGVWRFKAGFNGQVVGHIGAWDYPLRPGLYWLLTQAIPRYRQILRRKANKNLTGF